jgi:hypothetical protein
VLSGTHSELCSQVHILNSALRYIFQDSALCYTFWTQLSGSHSELFSQVHILDSALRFTFRTLLSGSLSGLCSQDHILDSALWCLFPDYVLRYTFHTLLSGKYIRTLLSRTYFRTLLSGYTVPTLLSGYTFRTRLSGTNFGLRSQVHNPDSALRYIIWNHDSSSVAQTGCASFVFFNIFSLLGKMKRKREPFHFLFEHSSQKP